jgi:hypothetical protein
MYEYDYWNQNVKNYLFISNNPYENLTLFLSRIRRKGLLTP